jgi:hypothetical protein
MDSKKALPIVQEGFLRARHAVPLQQLSFFTARLRRHVQHILDELPAPVGLIRKVASGILDLD